MNGYVKVEVEITEGTARWMRSMASVGRLCDSLMRALQAALNDLPEGEALNKVGEALDDVAAAKGPLAEVHLEMRKRLVERGIEPLWPQ